MDMQYMCMYAHAGRHAHIGMYVYIHIERALVTSSMCVPPMTQVYEPHTQTLETMPRKF
jgi:hypothetical protein